MRNSNAKFGIWLVSLKPVRWFMGLYAKFLSPFKGWWPELAEPYSAQSTNGTAIRFELRAGDKPRLAIGHRAELARIHEPDPASRWVRHSFSFMVPNNQRPEPDEKVIFAQWHAMANFGDPGGRSPPLSLRYRKGVIYVRSTVGPVEWPYAQPVTRGEWHDIALDVVWRGDHQGKYEFYLDGLKRLDYAGPTNYTGDTLAPFFKMGLYRPEHVQETQVIYIADYRRWLL